MKTTKLTLGMILAAALSQNISARDLLEGKPVYTLGEAKTWVSSNDVSYTFITEDLTKLTEVPANTTNIYLFPEEGGGWATDANKEIGIQGFYVDLGSSTVIGSVETKWEGAAANSYSIYVTDSEPTTAILSTTPTYTASGLGQYSDNIAVLPDGTRGRYLVFQPTDATNWGWGVKIRSISASAPQKSVLTTFTISPGLVMIGEQKELTIICKDQLGIDIEPTITVSDNATLENGMLTINSGDYATLTASYNGEELTANVYAATLAPELPSLSNITTPIFTNTLTDHNGTVVFTTAYNGGASNYGLFTYENGEVAQGFGDARCIFFSNSETTGAWNGNINPLENNYTSLCLSIFATRDVQGAVNFEGSSDPETVPVNNPFTLEAGKWNPIVVNIKGATRLNNMSVRFDKENASDILLANIYFSASQIASQIEMISDNAETFDVFNLQGVKVLSNAVNSEIATLPAGLYIINGKKVVLK